MRDVQCVRWGAALAVAAAVGLAGCSGSSTDAESTLTVEGNVPIAYAMRSTALNINPTNGAPFAAGGDLMIREKSSPSAPEINVTAVSHAGQGRRVGPRGLLRRQEDRVCAALPDEQHVERRRRTGLYRALEHLGIRFKRRPVERQLPPHHQLDDR